MVTENYKIERLTFAFVICGIEIVLVLAILNQIFKDPRSIDEQLKFKALEGKTICESMGGRWYPDGKEWSASDTLCIKEK